MAIAGAAGNAGASALGGTDGSGGVGGSAGSGVTATGGVGGSQSLPDADTPAGNIVPNPSFELESDDWVPWNSHVVVRTSSGPCSGSWCLVSSGRRESWQGPAFNMAAYVTPGQRYVVTAWARVSVPEDQLSIAMKVLCREASDTTTASQWFPVAAVRRVTNVWGSLNGTFTAPECEAPKQLQDLDLVFEGSAAGVDIYIDDVLIVPSDE